MHELFLTIIKFKILLFRPLIDGQDPDGGPKSCFIPGTDWDATVISSSCVCGKDYYGDDCGIPGAVWFSHYKENKKDRSLLRVMIYLMQNNE